MRCRLLCAAVVASTLVLSGGAGAAEELKIIHIRVGQGDATLILGPKTQAGERVRVLIDAGGLPSGGRDAGKIVGAVLWKNGVKEIDYLIVTHYDADHIGGIVAGSADTHATGFVFGKDQAPGEAGVDEDGDGDTDWLAPAWRKMYPDKEELGKGDDVPVKVFVDRGDSRPPTSQTYKKYRILTECMGTRDSLDSQDAVDHYEVDLGGGAKMTCLAANGYVRGRSSRVPQVDRENERSLCFLLEYGGFDYLAGGDTIGREYGSENAEVEIAIGDYLESQGVHVDMMHVNHHGGNNATTAELLDAIEPEIAVISMGNDNHYGHPHVDVLKRLVAGGVYRI